MNDDRGLPALPAVAGRTGPDPEQAPTLRDPARGVRSVILGSLLAVLAPLGGFLGGSMTGGTTAALDDLDPLFVWLFAGMLIGGIGAAVAVRGGLLWLRANYARD